MVSIGAITQKYQTCLNRATLWLNHNGYSVNNFILVNVRKGTEGDVAVVTTDTIHFRDWPYRHGSSERIHVLAEMIETVSLENGACVKATLRVNYFRIDGDRAIATESLHYDYGFPPQKKHPICHVQNSRTLLTGRPESFAREVDRSALEERCQNVRIPSAFVNLPGLFTILAADHMSEQHWREFMGHCLGHFRKLPAVPEGVLMDGAIAGEKLCAWAWYEM